MFAKFTGIQRFLGTLKEDVNADGLWQRLRNVEFGEHEISESRIMRAMAEDACIAWPSINAARRAMTA
jgi:hypothetical protein